MSSFSCEYGSNWQSPSGYNQECDLCTHYNVEVFSLTPVRYSWYRKLTTPSRWCEYIGAWCRRHTPRGPRVRRHVTPTPPTPTTTNENGEYPPATVANTPAATQQVILRLIGVSGVQLYHPLVIGHYH